MLRRLVKDLKFELEDDIAIDLIRSLLRRAIRKHLKRSTIRETVDLTMEYLETHSSARKEISINTGDVLHLVAFCWARAQDMFEKQLRKLCSDVDFGTSTIDHFANWDTFLKMIPEYRRYALLRLSLLESNGIDLNIDADLKKAKGRLEDALLDRLSPKEALSLFVRLRSGRGDDSLVAVGAANIIQGILSVCNTSGINVNMYHVALLNRNGLYAEARSIVCLATLHSQVVRQV